MANPEATQNLRDRDIEFLFFDESQVYVRGGSGGAGASTYKVMAGGQRGAANGGSGGKGGDVYLVCDSSLNTLAGLRGSASFHAERGEPGEARFATGRSGLNVEIVVPPGTVVRDRDAGNALLGELKEGGQRLLVAQGGQGGRGNAAQKLTRGQAPKAFPPAAGERRWLSLELRLVADVGLVGVPSAGKSTLLAAATNAKPKIADYPFTTLVPNLGVCDHDYLGCSGAGMVLADIPGLLEGAHRGVGLGRAFLRHVERCRAIIHVVSGTSPDPLGDFRAICQELTLFSKALAEKPQVVVVNKVDLPDAAERAEGLVAALREHAGHTRIMSISAHEGDGVLELMKRTRKFLDWVEAQELRRELEEQRRRMGAGGEQGGTAQEEEISEDVSRVSQVGTGLWAVRDARLAQMAGGMDWDYYGATGRFLKVMESLGVLDELREAGAVDGQLVEVGGQRLVMARPPEDVPT